MPHRTSNSESAETITLKQSRYLTLPSGDERFFTVVSGNVEVYACSRNGSEVYHKLFLTLLNPGDSCFAPPAPDTEVEFSVFGVTDAVLASENMDVSLAAKIAEGASEWFRKLAGLSWIRGPDGDPLRKWSKREIFAECAGPSDIVAACREHQFLFVGMAADQFADRERRAKARDEKRARQKEKTMFAALGSLLRTEYRVPEIAASIGDSDDPVAYAVKSAARKMGMETENIFLPPGIADKLDTLTRMRRLIRKANMQIRLVTLPEEWHKSDGGVLLAWYGEDKTPVALIPDGNCRYRMEGADFPLGAEVKDNVASLVHPDVFVCYAGLPARSLSIADMLRFVVKHCPASDWGTIWTMSLFAGLLAVVMPLITENIFSDIIPIHDRQALGAVTQVMLVSGFTLAILKLVRSIAVLRIKNHACVAAEAALWSRLVSLPARFFREYETGDLVNRMGGISAIVEMLHDNAVAGMFDMIFSFFSFILMLYYSPRLTAMASLTWIVYIAISVLLCRMAVFREWKKLDAKNRTSARTLQILNGLSKFRLRGGEDAAFALWASAFGNEWNWNLKKRWCRNYLAILNAVQPTILTMAVFYVAMYAVYPNDGGKPFLTYTRFIGFQSAFSAFNASLVSFIPLFSGLFNIVPHLENIKPILEAEPEVTDDKADVGSLSGEIEVKNLHFAYTPDGPPVIEGISFRIEAGESVAFVGPSGCGKSTLLRLLLGFEKPVQGTVSFDGQDLAAVNVASVRSQMGVVLQNGLLMSGDIFSNIVGTLPLTLEDAWEAARQVGFARDIEEMPMGMHTIVSEGAGNISGGQRQRILLARSIVNRPKIVILDEATSALDNVTQAIVTENMKKLNATRIVVAHRLSTIMEADRIFVLDGGRIAEEGKFEELLRQNGLFARLAQRQM